MKVHNLMSKSIVVGVLPVFCRNNNLNKIGTAEENNMVLNSSVIFYIPVTSSFTEGPALHC